MLSSPIYGEGTLWRFDFWKNIVGEEKWFRFLADLTYVASDSAGAIERIDCQKMDNKLPKEQWDHITDDELRAALGNSIAFNIVKKRIKGIEKNFTVQRDFDDKSGIFTDEYVYRLGRNFVQLEKTALCQ